MNELIAFAEAIAKAFPEGAKRDRFGRYMEGLQMEREPLRQLAVKYKIGGALDTQDQAGKVARAILRQGRVGKKAARLMKLNATPEEIRKVADYIEESLPKSEALGGLERKPE